MICYVKNLPDPIWQTGCFWFDNDVYAQIFAMYMGPMKVRETNFKTLKCFDIMFFYSYDQAKCWGVTVLVHH